MAVLAIWTPEDGLLGALAPLGLALAAPGPALMIDLDPLGPQYPGDVTLQRLVADEPRRDQLHPSGGGVAVLPNGGVPWDPARRVVAALMEGWRSVVLRLPPRPGAVSAPAPIVPVRMLLPGSLFRDLDVAAVYQATPGMVRPLDRPGVRLPAPSRATIEALLAGRRPAAGDRWIAAWRRAWRFQWR